jgi:hypothetical protein
VLPVSYVTICKAENENTCTLTKTSAMQATGNTNFVLGIGTRTTVLLENLPIILFLNIYSREYILLFFKFVPIIPKSILHQVEPRPGRNKNYIYIYIYIYYYSYLKCFFVSTPSFTHYCDHQETLFSNTV